MNLISKSVLKTVLKTLYVLHFLCCVFVIYSYYKSSNTRHPVVINTWNFLEANAKAWEVLKKGGSALDAIEVGCTACEKLQCDGTVGYGGSPDENGETTLDAMIIDGMSIDIGAVGALRKVKSAISVARHVLEHTEHTLLVGDQATNFAIEMGFKEESLTTNSSETIWKQWVTRACQPNFWKNVIPDHKTSCGPYKPSDKYEKFFDDANDFIEFDRHNHDTIGMVAIDEHGNIAAGTSTNGARHKIPGRVGDGPIPGAGAYAENGIGGAAATGDGDIMMRFLPSYRAVIELKKGSSPSSAANLALQDIIKYYKKFSGAVVVLSVTGEVSAACYGMKSFPYSVSFDGRASFVDNVSCIS